MKRIYKILSVFTILFITFFINKYSVYAASAKVELSANKTTVDIGDTITATVKVSEIDGKLGSWLVNISHSSELVLLEGEEIISEVGDGEIAEKSYELKYNAIKAGTANINITKAEVSDWSSENYINATTKNLSININSLPNTFIQIDEPSKNIARSSNIFIKGWVMSETSNKKVNIYIDDKLISDDDITFETREDVIKAITGYGSREQNPTPGYKIDISNNKYTSGAHTLKIQVVNATNGTIIAEKQKSFTIDPYKAFIQVDSTYNNDLVIGNNVEVRGWSMSDSSNKKIKIYFDQKEITNIENIVREDVLSSITGYGSREQNPTPGYKTIIPANYLSEGSHYIIINLVDLDNNEILGSKKILVNIVGTKSFIQIEKPKSSTLIQESLTVSGWSMSNITSKEIEIYIDNTKVENVEKIVREDVLNVITGYGSKEDNPTPGFKVVVPKNYLQEGKHILTINLKNLATNSVVDRRQMNLEIQPPKSTIYIDSPTNGTYSKDSNVLIRGWSMSNITLKEIEVYIDNTKINNVEKEAREDVLKAVTGYGSREDNPTPGFKVEVSAKTITSGKHTIKIRLVDKNSNEVLNEATKSITIEKPKSTIYIDEPTKTTYSKDSTITVRGWSMSNITSKEIEIYVDNTKLENVEKIAREDVLKAVTGYGSREDNPTPGFKVEVSAKTITSGKHTIKIRLVDKNSNEVLNEATKSITVEKPKSTIYIDEPTKTAYSKDDTITVRGWSMSNITSKEIEVYIDNTKVENVEKIVREDVLKAVTGYGSREDNPTPGFKTTIPTLNLKSGSHTIKIKLVDKNSNEVLNEVTKSITIEKPKSTIYIDEPTKTTYSKDDTITVRGWSMSNITSKEIEIYVDNTKVENVEKIVREDVLKVVTGYGSKEQNPTPGYKSEISAQKLKTGSHTIKIRLVDKNSNEVLNEATKSITVEKPKSTIYIDNPTDKTNKTELLISGWSMSNNLSKEIEIYVDNTKVENIEKLIREDVIKAVTGYGSREQNPTPGFKVIYDSSTLSDGTHIVKVNLIDSDTKEIYSTTSKKFTVKKYDGTIYLDTPTGGNFSSEFIVSGWEMSELDNSYIKIYVDGNQIPYTINREAREDVLKTVTEYGGRTTNSMPGFNVTIPITNYNEGMHTITIKLFTRLDEEISKYNKQIFISKSTSYGIDISEYQTVYNWNLVKAYGIDYAIIRSAYRGYGSAGRLVQDSKFFDHVKGASSVGLKLGTYVFSQAITEQEGRDEANLAIQMVNLAGGKSKFQMPIIFDAEYSSCAGHCGRADALSKQQRTNIVKAFCETVKNAGYTPMIYASPSFFNNNLDMSQLSEYQVWVANYGVSKPYYSGPYQIWQYTSDGSVTGINGRVDMNYIYLRY